jgi:hypothetical protein
MSRRGFWEDYPQRYWAETDWQSWERAGDLECRCTCGWIRCRRRLSTS